MFNLKKAKSAQSKNVSPSEKALEKNRKSLSTVANDDPSVYEDLLGEDRKDNPPKTTTDDQLKHSASDEAQIAEKKMKREKLGDLYVPAINAFVEKMVQDRRSEFTKAQKKEDNWTTAKPTQNADLPAWPKNTPQHEKTTLPGDVNRKQPNAEPLIGGKIVKASVDNVVLAVKSGATKNFDEQIVDILKKAHNDSRELTATEKKNISDIKKSRTQTYISEA